SVRLASVRRQASASWRIGITMVSRFTLELAMESVDPPAEPPPDVSPIVTGVPVITNPPAPAELEPPDVSVMTVAATGVGDPAPAVPPEVSGIDTPTVAPVAVPPPLEPPDAAV